MGDLAFISWYNDGIRVVDLTNPARPQEVGWFVSPGAIWGVHVQPERDTLVLASDFDFGLYLLRPVRPLVGSLSLDPMEVPPGGTFAAAFSGTEITEQTYFDIRFRTPGSNVEQEALNWQQGASAAHTVPPEMQKGTYNVTAVRSHIADHSGPYVPVSASLTVGP